MEVTVVAKKEKQQKKKKGQSVQDILSKTEAQLWLRLLPHWTKSTLVLKTQR